MQIHISKNYIEPGEYKNLESNNNPEFKKGIFILNTIYSPTLQLLKNYLYKEKSGNYAEMEKLYGQLKRIIDKVLNIEVFSDLRRYYPELLSSFESHDYYEDWYWEDLEQFGYIIEGEYKRIDSPIYPLPHEVQSVAKDISLIKEDKYDSKIIQKLIPSKDRLTILQDGTIEYYSHIKDSVRSAKFKLGSNQYKLIRFLAENPDKIYRFDELSEKLKRISSRNEFADKATRVRNTVKDIRKKLTLSSGELFLVSYGLGISCKVDIK